MNADHVPQALDGDGNGTPGGAYNFWFNTQMVAHTLLVDKLGPASGNDGSLAKPYTTISAALTRAASDSQSGVGDIVRIVGNNFETDNQGRTVLAVAGSQITDGQTFTVSDGIQTLVFEFDKDVPAKVQPGNVPVPFQTTDQASDVALSIARAINGALNPDGSKALKITATSSGWTVQLAGQTVIFDRQSGPLHTTLEGTVVPDPNNPGGYMMAYKTAYEIGTTGTGQNKRNLADGATMDLPRGVTVTIDAGAVFKLQGANIDVGSLAQNVDHSQGALQVLGTPATASTSRPTSTS